MQVGVLGVQLAVRLGQVYARPVELQRTEMQAAWCGTACATPDGTAVSTAVNAAAVTGKAIFFFTGLSSWNAGGAPAAGIRALPTAGLDTGTL
ncbi:hypothetical protein NJL88_28955 [Streptomyces sp. DK15]|uniref:hypothetical protein n=1 Tax=Streptomyces sp. DK15 TaxID=2957499 RepID=UPI0029ACC7F6|nr:hypothetical protein [Streptomyces sp. DK15]MDX2394023.1 hypothetical protein [Streptomyces sp. DK15]